MLSSAISSSAASRRRPCATRQNGLHSSGGGADESEENAGDGDDAIYLSLYFRSGVLAAALYNADTASLSVLSSVSELSPEFKMTKTLLHQLDPRHVLVDARQSAEFLGVVKQICGVANETENTESGEAADNGEVENGDEVDGDVQEDEGDAAMGDENGDNSTATDAAAPHASQVGSTAHSTSSGAATSTSQDSALRNTELHLLFGKNFSHPACRRRVLNVVLPQEVDPDSDRMVRSEDEHALLIGSLVDLNSNAGVRAAGALLQFADAHRIGAVNVDGGGGCLVLEIRPLSIDNVVAVDETTFTALQIFAEAAAPTSGSRFGSWNKRREGLSLFGLVSAHCKSALGSKYLRYMFRCPPRNLSVILQRQEVVAYFANPAQNDLVKILQGHLRSIRNLSHLLKKIATTQALVRDWKALLKSIQSLLTVGEIASTEREGSIEILKSLRNSVTDELHATTEHLARIFDAEESVTKGRFCVNPGVDEELDQKRRIHNGLPDLLQKVALEEINDLPEFMHACTMTYVPQVGYMLVVDPWDENETVTEETEAIQGLPDMDFLFCAGGVPHFKTRRCRELDEVIGDTATSIAEHETDIMVRLTKHVLARSDLILAPCRYAALLDCLLALAVTAGQYNWSRPYVAEHIHQVKIQAGRHPLQELCTPTFIPNDTTIGERARMAVLTGPNACGKSVYLKQVGMIALLAHLGSWVPAEVAVIPVMDRICTRIKTVESVSLGLSAFMVDVNQMSLAMRAATSRTLILVDEFGKGTSSVDGQALLAACLKKLLQSGADCPITLVSTHFHNIRNLIGGAAGVAFNTFECQKQDNGSILHLYRLKSGSCESSYATAVARAAGIDDSTAKRAEEVLACLRGGRAIARNPDVYREDAYVDMADSFLNLDLGDDSGLAGYFMKLRKMNIC